MRAWISSRLQERREHRAWARFPMWCEAVNGGLRSFWADQAQEMRGDHSGAEDHGRILTVRVVETA